MELSDIRQQTCGSNSLGTANIYENTAFSLATGETGENQEVYDQLNLSTVTSGRKDVDKENTSSPNRTKVLVYSILIMLVLLYIAVIVLIVIIILPKKNQVHGGWSTWSSWGPCSVSCDVGTQHRNRSCSNPYPSLTGDHCFGESRDDRICLSEACSDGNWSSWSSWGTCSESCDGGIRSQTRTCTNPKPSLLGKFCDGTPIQVSICNKQTCPASESIVGAKEDPIGVKGDPDKDGYSISISGTFYLNKNDYVYIGGNSGINNNVYNNSKTSFTGFLVSPDG